MAIQDRNSDLLRGNSAPGCFQTGSEGSQAQRRAIEDPVVKGSIKVCRCGGILFEDILRQVEIEIPSPFFIRRSAVHIRTDPAPDTTKSEGKAAQSLGIAVRDGSIVDFLGPLPLLHTNRMRCTRMPFVTLFEDRLSQIAYPQLKCINPLPPHFTPPKPFSDSLSNFPESNYHLSRV